MSRLDDASHTDMSAYLRALGHTIRSFAIVTALRAHVPLTEIADGGWLQFMALARPVLKNAGYTEQDIAGAWLLIERWSAGDPDPIVRKYLGRRPRGVAH